MIRFQLTNKRIKSQSGMALITVMLVISLCVILATEMVSLQSYQTKRITNLMERQQAYWYAMGSEHFVKGLLAETAKQDKGVFHLEQAWAMEGMSFPVDNGLIEGQITDLNSCFNLNALYEPNLADKDIKFRQQVFVRYLENLDITSEESLDDLANHLYDWLDPDDYAKEAGGYDGDMYSSLEFPYLSANSALAHENELRVIYGFDVAVMAQLQDRFCVIPQHHKFEFNINTIKQEESELLMAILNLPQDKVDEILDQRPNDGFKDIQDLWALAQMKNIKDVTAANNYFTVESKFFKLVTNAYYNEMKFALTSVIQLDDTYQTYVIGRRFGGKVEREANPEDEQPDN